MGRKLVPVLILTLIMTLVGCGEKADKEDMINAPVAPTTLDHEASSRARGMTDEEIAREKAQGPMGTPGTSGR